MGYLFFEKLICHTARPFKIASECKMCLKRNKNGEHVKYAVFLTQTFVVLQYIKYHLHYIKLLM